MVAARVRTGEYSWFRVAVRRRGPKCIEAPCCAAATNAHVSLDARHPLSPWMIHSTVNRRPASIAKERRDRNSISRDCMFESECARNDRTILREDPFSRYMPYTWTTVTGYERQDPRIQYHEDRHSMLLALRRAIKLVLLEKREESSLYRLSHGIDNLHEDAQRDLKESTCM